ncbi:MAG: ABC transporter ATP-binding protein [Acutalibacteraceae bacterium]|nr:ABC transporter ATP-binding protein [Acutalibacteraceae bacterium]
MRYLLKYFKGYIKEVIIAPLFKLTEAGFELLVPLIVAAMIDVGITDNDTPYIIKCAFILVLLGAVGLTVAITAQYFAAKAAVGFSCRIRHELMEHIGTLSFSDLDNIGTSTLIARITGDVNQIQQGVNMFLRLLLRSPFIVFGAMIMAFIVDSKAALVFVAVIPILFLIVFAIILITMPKYKKVRLANDSVMTSARENLSGARIIRAFNMEEHETKVFCERTSLWTRLNKVTGTISALLNPLTLVIINLGIAAVIYSGAIRVDTGVLSQGEVVALYSYMAQILVEVIKLANTVILVTKSFAAGSRVAEVLNTENVQKVIESNKSSNSYIEFSNVSLAYHGSDEALSNISFTASRGETVGIIGSTGSGKTSLVALLARFYDATKGDIYIDGKDIKSYEISALRRKIGFVMQKAELFSGTIRENLLFGNENAEKEQIKTAIEYSQSVDIIASKSNGLDEKIEQGGKNLSGGQRQRLSIARALIREPEILVLDDSTSALDAVTDANLRKAIKDLPSAPTVFIVSQRTSSIMNCDKIIVLDDGETVGIGTHKELLLSCKVYREIYESQFSEEENV